MLWSPAADRNHAFCMQPAGLAADCFWADQALKLKVTRFVFAAVIALNLKPSAATYAPDLHLQKKLLKNGTLSEVEDVLRSSLCLATKD